MQRRVRRRVCAWAGLVVAAAIGLVMVQPAPASSQTPPVFDGISAPLGGTAYANKWRKTTLTWRIEQASSNIEIPGIETSQLGQAVEAWDDVLPTLDLAPASSGSPADISFRWTMDPKILTCGGHDSDRVLGCEYPQLGLDLFRSHSDIYFNDRYRWKAGSSCNCDGTVNIRSVAVHEIGHALGLGDVVNAAAVMNRTSQGSAMNAPKNPDIIAAQALYGTIPPPKLDVFTPNSAGKLHHSFWDPPYGRFWNWAAAGSDGTLASDPAAAAEPNGTINVVTRGTDGGVYLKSKAPSWSAWSAWQPLGGNTGSSPAITAQANGALHVFVRGTDHRLWQRFRVGTSWSNWDRVPGDNPPLSGFLHQESGPAAAAEGNKVHIAIRGTDNGVHHKFWDPFSGQWSAWTKIGTGTTSADPAITAMGSKVHIFVRGFGTSHRSIYHAFWEPVAQYWQDWTSILGNADSAPDAAARGQMLDVVVRTPTGTLQNWHYDGFLGFTTKWQETGLAGVQSGRGPALAYRWN